MAKSKVATRKRDLDYRVATTLGVNRRMVAAITTAFVREVMNAVVEQGGVHVDALGRFELRIYDPPVKTRRLVQGNFKKGGRGGTIDVEVPYLTRVLFTRSATFKELTREYIREQEGGHLGKVRGGRRRRSGKAREAGG